MRISYWSSDVCSSDLADVVDEVGKDAVRFTMLTRKAAAQMDFDFARVVEASRDNPIWYLQYAHARISRLRQKAADAGIALPEPAPARLNAHELGLVKLLAQFPRMVESAASRSEGSRVGKECVSTCRSRWSAYH